MPEFVQFPSTVELPTQYQVLAATGVANAETVAITLKSPWVDSASVAAINSNTQATLYINFTKGSLTNCSIKLYGSYLENPTTNDWYQEVVETDSTGVATLDPFSILLTADAKIAYHFPIGAYKTFKITVSSTGTITNSAITLNLGLRCN